MRLKSFIAGLLCLVAVSPVLAGSMTLVGVGKPAAAGGGGCAEATALVARMDGSQNTSAVTTAVCGMVTDGTYAMLDWLYVFAVNSSGNALLNWKSTSFNPTVVGANCTFTANAGYAGGASCHLDTGYTPSTAGGNATLNSTTAGACVETSSVAASGAQIGVQDGGGAGFIWAASNGGGAVTFTALNDGAFTTTYSPTNAQGSWILSRTAVSTLTYYLNGTSVATPNTTSSFLQTVAVYVLARNNAGTESSQSNSALNIGYAFWASGMNATQVSNMRTRLGTYMTAVGASGC